MDSSEEEDGMILGDYSPDNSLLYNETFNRVNNLALEILNTTWNNVLLLLSDWQKEELAKVDSESGIRCLLGMWFDNRESDLDGFDAEFCNATWDGIYCWPAIPVGTQIKRTCSEIFRDSHLQEGEVTRFCIENGTQLEDGNINYDVCTSNVIWDRSTESKGYLSHFVRHMVFVGSILSLFCLSVALAIFYSYKNLRTQRFTVHIHLMLALLLRFILLFVITEPFVFKREITYRDNDLVCKLVILTYLYSTVVSVMWMLVQGIHLNGKLTTNLLTGESSNRFRFYYLLGWGFPGVILVVYLALMIINGHNEKCWRGYSDMIEIWIVLAPIIAALTINGLFLLNILSVVTQKTQCQNTRPERSNLISVAKATLVLFPVLGINNLLLVYNPGGVFQKYFVSLNTFFGSTQGIFVAVVYCFMSKEVQQTIHRSFNRFRVRRSAGGIRSGSRRKQYSMASMSNNAPRQDETYNESDFV